MDYDNDTAPLPTAPEWAAWSTGPTIGPSDEDEPISVPCRIHTSFKVGYPFVVKDVGAWQHTDEGIFATGTWLGDEREIDILIPYHHINYIQFDFDALEAFVTEAS